LSIQKFHRAAMQNEDQEPMDNTPPGEAFEAYDTLYPSMVCAGCSCLCDDISIYVRNGQVVRTLNLCEVGAAQLSSVSGDGRMPPLSPDRYREAVQRAAAILRENPSPLVLGADVLDDRAMQGSWDLAGHLRGLWLSWAFPEVRSFYHRVKTFGWATALLDEVRDQADLVLFWKADPLVTHHRHLSRYSFFARGRFTERGNHDRILAVVAPDHTTIEPLCQQFFCLAGEQEEAFTRALTSPGPGQDFDHRDFPLLGRALNGATYVAVFLDPGHVSGEILDALFEWSGQVNSQARKRLVILPLWSAGANIEGCIQFCLEKIAAAWGADFSGGSPGPVDRDVTWETLDRHVESVLMIPPAPGTPGGDVLPDPLARMPRICVDPFKNVPSPAADVVIPAALPGVEHHGEFVRADGLPLKASCLEAFADGVYPSVEQVLLDILREAG
jgi:formylmethanofuran dehydrogenase subunit B